MMRREPQADESSLREFIEKRLRENAVSGLLTLSPYSTNSPALRLSNRNDSNHTNTSSDKNSVVYMAVMRIE